MQIGVVGGGADIEALVAAATARGDRIVTVADPTDRPAVDRLLDEAACAAVAVGADGWPEDEPTLRADTVRLLVQAGRTLVLSHPLESSMLWAYELDMIRRDSGAVLIPWLPARLHPYIARLVGAVEVALAGGGGLGPLETLRLERRMASRTRDAVLASLARDVDLVRVLVGEPARLATLGGADADAAWGTLAVGFSGPTMVPARWQVGPGGPSGLTITLQHAGGSVVVEAPDDGPWTWSGPPGETAAFDGGEAMRAVLDRAVLGAEARPLGRVSPASWADASRAIELAETVPRSLVKGRSVDLHREEFSEIGTFRGTMASLGCGLVLLGLFVLVLATLVGGIAREFGWEFGKRVAGAWPGIVLATLTVFLALQLVPLLIGAEQGRPPPAGGDEARPGKPG
jgi:myo-inositol 2-dehydrogenase/D-chiro-inositol 1-dehydrogenase